MQPNSNNCKFTMTYEGSKKFSLGDKLSEVSEYFRSAQEQGLNFSLFVDYKHNATGTEMEIAIPNGCSPIDTVTQAINRFFLYKGKMSGKECLFGNGCSFRVVHNNKQVFTISIPKTHKIEDIVLDIARAGTLGVLVIDCDPVHTDEIPPKIFRIVL